MGTLGELCYRAVVWWNWVWAWFASTKRLHTARFARLDELQSLLSNKLDSTPSLLLGRGRFNQTLSVRSQKKRRELGNVLVVAPTRGGQRASGN